MRVRIFVVIMILIISHASVYAELKTGLSLSYGLTELTADPVTADPWMLQFKTLTVNAFLDIPFYTGSNLALFIEPGFGVLFTTFYLNLYARLYAEMTLADFFGVSLFTGWKNWLTFGKYAGLGEAGLRAAFFKFFFAEISLEFMVFHNSTYESFFDSLLRCGCGVLLKL